MQSTRDFAVAIDLQVENIEILQSQGFKPPEEMDNYIEEVQKTPHFICPGWRADMLTQALYNHREGHVK